MVFDAVIVGAGAAGLFCAGVAAQRGARVLLVDHSDRVAEKVRISGGGRCNFTNRDLDVRAPHLHFLSENPKFCRSALSRYTPADFIALLQRHGIPFHEKHKGQLFCDRSAQDLIDMLLRECEVGAAGGQVTRWQDCRVHSVGHEAAGADAIASYRIDTDQGVVRAKSLVVATGGLSIPKIGASDWAWRVARQFELPVVAPRPGLVPLTFDARTWGSLVELAGVSLPVRIATGPRKTRVAFDEDLLWTHRGLSGPAVLQVSSYWDSGTPLHVDLCPGLDVAAALLALKQGGSRRTTANELATWLPQRLAQAWTAADPLLQRPINDVPDKALIGLAQRVNGWEITPDGSEGYAKAEVTVGGVSTQALSSQSLESKTQPGLYFIGEAVDVTGWLGGYNFQWAWSSAHACALALTSSASAR